MTDSTFDQRLTLRDIKRGTAIVISLIVLLGAILAWFKPGKDYRDPGCESQNGEPGIIQMAQPATPDTFNICFPNTITQGEFQVLPPQ